VLEGLTGSGKTTLTERPFLVDGKCSLNIEIDQFFRRYSHTFRVDVPRCDQPAVLTGTATNSARVSGISCRS
jgi:hypothetical protein